MLAQDFEHCYATVNGVRYHYVNEGHGSTVVLLLHGFPDFWYGWRHQIKFLGAHGYRVIAPDLRGYGQTDGADTLAAYSMRSVGSDMMLLLTQLGIKRAVVIGHDWGGMLAWRIAMHFPHRVVAVGSLCTPYTPPDPIYHSLEDTVKQAPNLAYQVYLASEQAVADLDAKPESFLHMVLRRWNEAVDISKADKWHQRGTQVPVSQLLTPEERDYYVSTFRNSGFRGPLSWYRMRKINYEEDQGLPSRIELPALMITAEHDTALPPSMAAKMPQFFSNLTMEAAKDCGHWLMVEQTEQVNAFLLSFLQKTAPAILPTKM
ncbi:putative epoxide hydrolase [Thamnocephalis sphaerospora]|uniref:Putative epoxide hydrolase n=1 Tax=Thamnocephalis sphaerospora TaxID=78915 RepID=A0A4P9XVL9_9FUNG|nr:putative epoxide hydrolase [Thamnocephalis sphaerospora]|eukprot:RKP09651.1 putative epoxide hydrolase [Thamnocephalis sphaerospora]